MTSHCHVVTWSSAPSPQNVHPHDSIVISGITELTKLELSWYINSRWDIALGEQQVSNSKPRFCISRFLAWWMVANKPALLVSKWVERWQAPLQKLAWKPCGIIIQSQPMSRNLMNKLSLQQAELPTKVHSLLRLTRELRLLLDVSIMINGANPPCVEADRAWTTSLSSTPRSSHLTWIKCSPRPCFCHLLTLCLRSKVSHPTMLGSWSTVDPKVAGR